MAPLSKNKFKLIIIALLAVSSCAPSTAMISDAEFVKSVCNGKNKTAENFNGLMATEIYRCQDYFKVTPSHLLADAGPAYYDHSGEYYLTCGGWNHDPKECQRLSKLSCEQIADSCVDDN
jgi:hypothetical protein